jgi:hypothetical protein
MKKLCPDCKITKEVCEFYKWSYGKDGLQIYCKICIKKRNSANYYRNAKYYKEWFANHYKKNKVRHYQQQRQYVAKVRLEILMAYGGKCVCCGFDDLDFLTIDHIGGRKVTPKMTSNPTGEYLKIKAMRYPKDKYRCLCHNCNMAGRYGKCPHEMRRLEKVE